MIRTKGKKAKDKKGIEACGSSPVLIYTYAGKGEEEVSALKKIASWWAWAGQSRLAQALAELADELQIGITMGAVDPGDTVYHAIV